MNRDLSGLPTLLVVLVIGFDVVVRIVALLVVPRGRRPSSALGWLLAIFFLPI